MVTAVIISFVLFAVQCLIESKLESIEIALKVQAGSLPDYAELNRQEHTWSAAFSIGFVILIAVFASFSWPFLLWKIIPYVLTMAIIRRIFFDYGLKIFRKRPLSAIEGDQKTDTAVRKVLGAHGGIIELAIDFALLAGFIYLTL